MGIRLTGISTPFIGAEWEYTDKQECTAPLTIFPDQKINVFISSICGDNGKYDRVRASLKKTIEDTNLAKVYLFEKKDASTLSAGEHYIWALEDSDICIFLIDNADGVTPGVQKEIDTVKSRNIKSLYYFCDETTKEKTALERSIMGATYAKSKTVHQFDELSQDGARALINDIVNIYLNYCRGRLISRSEYVEDNFHEINLLKNASYHAPTMPKTVINNIDKCKEYILKQTLGYSSGNLFHENIKTSEIDEWGVQFLTVLFEGKSIKHFNTGMFLDTLKTLQDEEYYQIVSIRWQAIQAHFLGDVARCVQILETALNRAKETKQPSWIIQDILIDLRNQQLILDTANNRFTESSAQKELDESEEDVYYPVLDRIHDSLQEKYINGLYKKKTQSPYTVTISNDYDEYGALLASSFIVSIYNGSLTHILRFYEKIRDFLFYLCCKYDDWSFRKDLLKLAIYGRNEKEIKGIQDSYPEVLNNMTDKDAAEIMAFCNNHPVEYQRISSQLLAFGSIGYYLNDSDYVMYEEQIINGIKEWLNNENVVVAIGQDVFKCLMGIAYRVSQDVLVEICCLFMDKHYRRWFMDMFKFIDKRIDLRKMSNSSSKLLIQHIIRVLENGDERQEIKYAPSFLYILRKQDRDMTNELDRKISEYLPEFYNGTYKLETTEDKCQDFPKFIQRYVKRIVNSNESQGKNGCFSIHGTRDIATVRAVLLDDGFACSNEIMDALISAVSDTLLISKEGINIKLDAISLLICISIKYPEDYIRNADAFNCILEKKDDIVDIENTFMSSNIDKISLKIALSLLYSAMGGDGYIDFLEGMSYIQNDIATTISVMRIINEYLEVKDSVLFPKKIETVVLQNVLQWLHFDYVDIRWNATRILFKLIRNSENEGLVNQKVINLIDNDCVYIKNLIIRQIFKVNGIYKSTQEYVLSKCQHDSCFVVRMVCAELQRKQVAVDEANS